MTSSSTSFEDLCPETPKYTEVQYRCANNTSGSSGDSVDRQQLRFRDDKISRVWEPVVVKHVSQSDILLSLNTSRGIVSVSSNSSSNSRNASANHLNSLADAALLESSATVPAQESETVAPMIDDAAETGNTTQDQSLVASQEENSSNTDTNEEKEEELSEKKVITIAVVVCASLTVLLIVLSLTSSKVIII